MVSLIELESKYGMKIPFTEYYKIIKAIPHSWKEILSQPDTDSREDYKLIDRIDDSPNPSQLLYGIMLEKEFKPPTKKAEKWSDELC